MPPALRQWVSELMIYDADDKSCSDEAAELLDSHKVGGWTVGAAGVRGVAELSKTLQDFVNIHQLSFCTHGFPGGVHFKGGSLTSVNLKTVSVPPRLFNGPGRLLFMGCETARTKAGEDFIVEAGKYFFTGKGGVVGGSTIFNLGFSSGCRLPILGDSSGGWGIGQLILFHLDAQGKVIERKAVKPFGL